MTKYLVEVDYEHYRSSEGHHLRREETGETPNGNPLSGWWVLRDKDFNYIDHDQFRHDLMEQHGFVLVNSIKEFLGKVMA